MPSRKGRDVSVPWDLLTDHEGWPILPLELNLPLPQLNEILQSFLTITYHESILFKSPSLTSHFQNVGNTTKNKKVAVPWQLIADAPQSLLPSRGHANSQTFKNALC